MSKTSQSFNVFRITSKFPTQKSEFIGKNYLIIDQWQRAGLKKPCCVDTTRTYKVNRKYIMQHMPIGRLAPIDVFRLFQFLLIKNRNS